MWPAGESAAEPHSTIRQFTANGRNDTNSTGPTTEELSLIDIMVECE